MKQEVSYGRRASILVLAWIVLLVTAVPVLADPSEPGPEPPAAGETVLRASEYGVPSAASIEAAHLAAMREDRERETELEEEPFVAQRESSRRAYANAIPAEAEELFLSTFSETLAGLNNEPARLLSDVKLDRNLGHGSAVITDEGRHEILEAGMPVEAENAEGEVEKVDLDLEPGPEGFEPENPLTEVSIGATAEEGIVVGEEGLTVTQAGAEESKGRLLGDKSVFFGEVEEGSDTDLIASPTAHGVELFDMLRSVDSPETLRFDLELPAGDTVRESLDGGAEIVDPEGTIVGAVPKPHGEDAQGTELPVGLEVEGDSIVLQVERNPDEIAFPALIDPEVEVWEFWGYWYLGQNLQGTSHWGWYSNIPGDRPLPVTETPWAGRGWQGGLFAEIGTGETNAGNYSAFYLNAPNTNVWLSGVEINPFQMYDGSCEGLAAYREPYDFEGYIDVARGVWNEITFEEARHQGWTHHANWGHQYEFGLEVDLNHYFSPCWRYLAAGGVAFHMGDWSEPSMQWAASSIGERWINGATPFTISVAASDPGLGIKEFAFVPEAANPGNPVPKWTGCVGTYESLCRNEYSGAFSFVGAEFPKGEDTLSIAARDPTEKRSPYPIPLTIKVDPEPPVVHLNGQLMSAVQEGEGQVGEKQGEGGPELSQPVYNLGVEATDGVEGTTVAKLKQSGVKEIQVIVTDPTGKVESTKSFPNTKSPCSSCEEKITYAIPMTGLTAGKHKLKVKTWDNAGNNPAELEKEFEYIPATGLTEADVTQRFPLPDGKEHGEDSYQGPELAVNVMNGNVVYRQRDVDVEGPSADLEAELFYNSLLPAAESSEFGRGWTLSQMPSLKPSGNTATALTSESTLAANVALPAEVGKEQFSQKLDAVITKEPGGGYSVSEEGGIEAPATVYNAAGTVTEAQTGTTSSVNYGYAGGHLSEIAVDDAGSTDVAPPPAKKAPSMVPVYVSSVGSTGAGNGQFSHPADVALDAKGNEWIADSGNNRVEEFTPGGDFLKSLGSAGAGNGQFTTPKSLAFDAAGNLWVDDAGNSRLEEFGPSGTFIKAVGTNGSGNGQFNRPEGIAISPGGHIWVADTYNHRIVELNSAGEFINVVNPSGLGAIEPTGIDVGPDGNVWVADWAHNRVVELSPAGELVRQVGSEGTGEGQFKRPDAIAVGVLGEVWVGDQNNERVQELTKEGRYVTQFGSGGTGAGQFSFSYPLGIATDNEGSLFVTDTNNNRVEHWQVPHFGYKAVFAAAFGTVGNGPGQYRHPGDLAVDDHGDVWIPDVENNRLQELNRKGEFVRQFGSLGSGNGQFRSPKSVAFTNDGEFWVADSGNGRLEKFTEKGEFIKSVGSVGSGNGQFNGPEAIAIAPNGHIWVADTYNHRIVELDEEGNFIKVVNPTGLGSIEPTGIAFGPGGNAWIADWARNRVVEINPAGELVRQFGTSGTGNGQFARPDTVAIDPRGIVYVVDQNNGRVQVFNQSGEYLAQFGAPGAGTGQFSFAYPTGVAADGRGDIWVADNNNRIQKWLTGAWVPEEEEEAIPAHDDPSVAVVTSAGLVTSVVGTEAGSHHYSHTGELLTSDEGPEGTFHYEYEVNRLHKVTLPNGSAATVKYDNLGRAIEVTVTPAGGQPKWTKFEYLQEISTTMAQNHGVQLGSREVIVEPETGARTFYAIDSAGDVVKSWNVEVAPIIFSEEGTLTQNSKEKAIDGNDTQKLFINAFAPEGVRKIQFIVNGSTVVDEKTCTGTAKECEHETLDWIVEPADLPAGTMWIEVAISSRVEEHGEPRKSSTRWWLTVPYVPPPEPGIPQPPKYKKVLTFREEYGLDLDLNPVANELTLHNRVWETIDAWWTPSTEAGQVANATWERWGVPLRYVDEQELEYREWLYSTNAAKIDAWVEATEPASFAGYYLDNRAGGIMYVGFLGNQEEQLNQMKASLNLVAQGRVKVYPVPPTVSYLSARATAQSVVNAIETSSSLAAFVTSVRLEKSGTLVHVGATNPAQVESALLQAVPGAHVVVQFEPRTGQLLSGRYRTDGRMRGGDAVFAHTPFGGHNIKCSAGFGTKTRDGQSGGQQHWKVFTLTAGHCVFYGIGTGFYRSTDTDQEDESDWSEIGTVQHDRYPRGNITMDAAAIEAHTPKLVPQGQWGANGNLVPTQPAGTVHVNQSVCFSGIMTQFTCGLVTEITPYWAGVEEQSSHAPRAGYWVKFETPADHGDSGAPVWSVFGDSIGLISAMGGPNEKHGPNETFVEPLLTPPGLNRFTATGVLTDPAFAPMSLKLAADGE